MQTLIIVERDDGKWYGGYEKIGNEHKQLFNSNASLLFMSMKYYTDKGYAIECISKDEFFDSGKPSMEKYFGGLI